MDVNKAMSEVQILRCWLRHNCYV